MAVYIGNNNAQLCIEKYKDVRCCLYLSFLSPPTGSLCGTISGDPIYRTISCCSLKERKTFRGKELRRRKKNNKTTRFSLKGDRNVFTNCPFQHSLQQTTIHIHVFLNINFVTAALLRDEACECYSSSHLFIPAAVGFIFLFGINPKSQKTIWTCVCCFSFFFSSNYTTTLWYVQ